ncbi:type II secretion system protein GspG [Ketobacter sp. MCCC 1A13808]|uniref:type II secretion system major pseudopilin GspG n=1 Tax=Ketobacter sp. MCCC 1A13808 TaxID=2602738 RepID=UPI000F16B623|nr:type II secretion system major pseudopilin GspG [Ketobacter sp. MCCC 1A13808]MVF10527.1 type II secretion system protein GspG [Ketobacter sp. MCCC 1A13808]RLP55957.1 MAG: type II secretion system protein GspG [Ketobacter sp.]
MKQLNRTLRTSSQQGFTLIEVMIVVAILGVLATLVVVSVGGQTDKANITAAKSNMSTLSKALDLYKLDNFRYPTTDEGLEALVEKPDSARNWPDGGYIKKVPLDPWQSPFVYISPGSEGPFDLYSLGADGVEGGEGSGADIFEKDI